MASARSRGGADRAVIETATDALQCKSCVIVVIPTAGQLASPSALCASVISRLGLFSDKWSEQFCPTAPRRSPLIHRGSFVLGMGARRARAGYFARCQAVWEEVVKFIAGGPADRQIVVLGAGWESLFFRLEDAGLRPRAYLEIDYPDVIAAKAKFLVGADAFNAVLGRLGEGFDAALSEFGAQERTTDTAAPSGAPHLHVGPFHLVGADVRDIAQLNAAVQSTNVDCSLPTLVLAECVLVYLEPSDGDAVISWAAETFSSSTFVAYDPFRPDDAFGTMMVQNLKRRGCALRALAKYRSLDDHIVRFKDRGWVDVGAWDMDDVYDSRISPSERARVERIEGLDELEEWRLILQHYIFIIAGRGAARSDAEPATTA